MAGQDFDVFSLRVFAARRLDAALPGDHAVGTRINAGGRHGRRLRQVVAFAFLLDAAAAGQLVKPPGMGRSVRTGERRSQGDDAAHHLRHFLGQFARIDAAQAPAQQADLAAGAFESAHQLVPGVVQNARARAEIESLVPAAG